MPAFLEQQVLGFFGVQTLLLRAHALQTELELAGNGDGTIDVCLGEIVRDRVVHLNLPASLPVAVSGMKGNPLRLDCGHCWPKRLGSFAPQDTYRSANGRHGGHGHTGTEIST